MPTPARQFKDDVFGELARIGKALASPKRLELLDVIAQGPRTVEALAELTGVTVANASQHLQVLRGARLLAAEKSGTFVTYRLAPGVADLYLSLRALGEDRLPELAALRLAFFRERDTLEPHGADDLLRRALAGDVTVIDVRPVEEFRAGHLPAARSVPLAELEARLAELPRDREIVAYCRGPYCVYAADAVQVLRAHGFVAHRLEQGPLDWARAGIPLGTGAPVGA